GRRDAVLYLIAAGLGSFGLGVAQFYLNFFYRSLGFDAFAIGLLAGAEALVVVAGAIPAAIFTRGRSRRAAILLGGTLTGVGILFGFGAGSFLPFVNLFFADRYGVPFSALGLLLGVLAVAGSIGALLHGRFVAARLGAIPSIVLVETLSLPFALVAAFTGALPIAVGALATRHFLMFGASGTVNAFQLSSFTPAERAAANAVFAL